MNTEAKFVRLVMRPENLVRTTKDGDVLPAPCRDCCRETEPMNRGRPVFRKWDFYIVRDEVWMDAGMGPWKSGFLCSPCLEKRLGRELTDDDYLARQVGATKSELRFEVTPEYLERALNGRGY